MLVSSVHFFTEIFHKLVVVLMENAQSEFD